MQLITAALLTLAATAPTSPVYVILEGFARDDPFHAVSEIIARHHGTRHILRFDPEAPAAILPALRKLRPHHVAIVLRPDQIHVNSVRRILAMATRVDPDPFVDFEFGYITGATFEHAVAFARNIVRVPEVEQPRIVGHAEVIGGRDQSTATIGKWQLGTLSMEERTLWFRAPDGKHGRDQPFIDANLARLEGCGAIMMGGPGAPRAIETGPRSEDIAKLDLFPAVAFNYACHTGVLGLYPHLRKDGEMHIALGLAQE